MRSFIIIVAIGLLEFTGGVTAQSRPLNFLNYGAEAGLLSNTVNGLVRDRTGYLWLASSRGIYRFDGYRFRGFHHDPAHPGSLPDNHTTSLFVDTDDRIWVGTNVGGVARFDRYTEGFRTFRNLPADTGNISYNQVNAFAEPVAGQVWAVTSWGYNVWDAKTDRFRIHRSPPGWWLPRKRSLPGLAAELPAAPDSLLRKISTWADYVYYDRRHARAALGEHLGAFWAPRAWSVLEPLLEREPPGTYGGYAYSDITAVSPDGEGGVFFGYRGGGVARLRRSGDYPEILHPNLTDRTDRKLPAVVALLRVGDHLYQARSGGGLRVTDLPNGVAVATRVAVNGRSVNDLRRQGNLLYLGTNGGLLVHDLDTGRQWWHGKDARGERAIVTNECLRVLPGADGTVWVGHGRHGLSRGSSPQPFVPFPARGADLPPPGRQTVTALLADRRGNLWQGFYEGGIRRLAATDLRQTGLYLTASTPAISRSTIFTLREDRSGTVWAGGYDCGLLRFAEERDDFVPGPWTFDQMGGSDIRAISEDRAGRLWVAVHGFGISRLDPATGAVTRYPGFGGSRNNAYVFDLLTDDEDRVYGASVTGVYRLEADHETITPILTGPPQGLRAYALAKGEDGRIWVGTDEGLRVIGPDGYPEESLAVPARLATGAIRALLPAPGPATGLWVGQQGAFHHFDPATGAVFSYVVPPHLGATDFFGGSRAVLADGRLAFGYHYGMLLFRPEDLRRQPRVPPPVITELQVPGDSALTAAFRGGKGGELRLPHANQGLRLDLSTLSLPDQSAVSYEVRMLPRQENWQRLAGERPRYTLYGVPPGKHTLEFRASVANGTGYSPVLRLRLRVPQPWYLSPGAFAGYGFLLVGFMLGYRKYVRYRSGLERTVEVARLRAAQAREVAAAKAEFFLNVSHELRTPLTLIEGPLRELARDPALPPGRRREFYAMMQRNTGRLRRLVDRLLDLQKLELEAPDLRLGEGLLFTGLRQMIAPFRERARTGGQTLLADLPERDTKAVFSAEALERVLDNLLGNALKFTPPGSTIRVRASIGETEQGKLLRLTVEDDGPGIPAREQSRIFERHFRGAGSGELPGAGVGLAIAREYAELAGGWLECRSGPGEGARFTFGLPLHPATGKPVASADAPTAADGAQRPLLLFVDDDADVRALLRAGCADGYRILEAANGEEALALARNRQPSLILTDLMMPGMDGVELCQHLKRDRRTSHLPVLLLTARHSGEARRLALRAGANDYLTKPFDPHNLRRKIANTLTTLEAARRRWLAEPTPLAEEAIAAADADQAFLRTLRRYVEEHMDVADLDLNDLLRALAVSRSVGYAKVKALTGLPLKAFIKRLRIGRARQLLEQTDLAVGEIAYQTGFKTTQHFSRSFREIVGSSPSAFREDKRRIRG